MTTTTLTPPIDATDDFAALPEVSPVANLYNCAPDISVVIPLFNEEESVPHLYRSLTDALQAYGRPYEVIVVDDGRDNSFALLKELALKDPFFTVIQLRRNFGQTAAFSAGFASARRSGHHHGRRSAKRPAGHPAILMAKIDEGYDIVSGWRKDRQDRFLDRSLPSMLANRLISNVTDVQLHDYGCSLKAYRREVLQHVRLYGELHRFIPALASQVGGTVTEVPVNHRSRQFGRSKYGIGRTVRVMLDLITVWFLGTYSTRPIHVFGTFGLLSALGGVIGRSLSDHLKMVLARILGSARCCCWRCCWW